MVADGREVYRFADRDFWNKKVHHGHHQTIIS